MAFPWTETFDGVTAPSLPAGWTFGGSSYETTTATAGITPTSLPNMLQLPNTGVPTSFFGMYGSPDTNGGNVSLVCNLNGNTDSPVHEFDVGLVARASSTTVTATSGTFYWLQWDIAAANVNLYAIVAGVQTLVHQFTLTTPLPEWLQFTWKLIGTSITLSIQRISDGFWYDPGTGFVSSFIQAFSVTDSSISGAGYGGLAGFNRSDTGVFWDDWTFDVASAPTSPPIYPHPQPAYPLLEALGYWSPPGPSVALQGLPSLLRTGGLFQSIQASAPLEEEPPRVFLGDRIVQDVRPPSPAQYALPEPVRDADDLAARIVPTLELPSVGLPTPLSIGPPGLPRPVLGLDEDIPSLAIPPIGLPSVGTQTLDFIGPPGFPAVVQPPDDPPIVVSIPLITGIPSGGTPTPTGPGLLVPPNRIAIGWDEGLMASLGVGLDLPYKAQSPTPTPTPTPTGGGPFQLGGICNCCGGKTCVCVYDCAGAPVGSASIRLSKGGTPVGGCVTGADGCCSPPGVDPGTYTAVVDDSGGNEIFDGAVVLTTGKCISIRPYCCVKICIFDCGGVPANRPYTCASVKITITNPNTGVRLAQGYTDTGTGCVTLSYPLLEASGGRLTITADPGSGGAYRATTITTNSPCGTPTSPAVITIELQANIPTYNCCCGQPIPLDLTLTDAKGTHSFNFCSGRFSGWFACYTFPKSPTTDCATVFNATLNISIWYQATCNQFSVVNGKNVCTFDVTRTWGSIRSSNVLPPGTFNYLPGLCATPFGCPEPLVGNFCQGLTSFPGATNADISRISIVADPCEPFALSGTMTPDARNIMPDPVGGTIAIS